MDNNQTAMTLLKADLGYYDSAIPQSLETYLSSLLTAAEARIQRDGITLIPGNVNDDLFLASYAAWLYRKRREGSAKPPMIQAELRDRQVAEALKAAETEDAL